MLIELKALNILEVYGKNGKGECRHNNRINCRYVCNICKESWPCKLCHDEEYMQPNKEDAHELIFKDVKEIKCRQCDTI